MKPPWRPCATWSAEATAIQALEGIYGKAGGGEQGQIAEQLASAKRNFEVGTATITDTREAEARFDLSTAQEIAAENDLQTKRITLDQLVLEPLITYHPSFTGRTRIDQAFALRHLRPNIVLEAIDSDVIKTYVDLGLGVGIVASLAFEPERDVNLDAIEAGPLFGINLTRLAVRRGNYLRGFVYSFIESFAPTLAHAHVRAILAGEAPVPASLIAP